MSIRHFAAGTKLFEPTAHFTKSLRALDLKEYSVVNKVNSMTADVHGSLRPVPHFTNMDQLSTLRPRQNGRHFPDDIFK